MCPKCKLSVESSSIVCQCCLRKYHPECTQLPSFEVDLLLKHRFNTWICQLCVDKYCKHCKKSFSHNNLDSICCDKCNRWFHSYCSGLSNSEFQSQVTDISKNWTCNSCNNKFCHKCNIPFKKKNKG